MILIEFYNDGIIITGHAMAAPCGKDIYCAGVSAIVMGALNWFHTNEIDYNYHDGFYSLKLRKVNEKTIEKLNLIKIQLQSLNHDEYKKYLKMIDHKKGVSND